MAAVQNTIALVFDYDETLSPNYMQDEVLFPAFGIDPKPFWTRCQALVREQGYESELAYMKVLLDTVEFDRPSNAQLRELGANLTFFPGLPEMFEEFERRAARAGGKGARDRRGVLYYFQRVQGDHRRQPVAPYIKAIFGCEYAEDAAGRITFPIG